MPTYDEKLSVDSVARKQLNSEIVFLVGGGLVNSILWQFYCYTAKIYSVTTKKDISPVSFSI